MVRILVAEDDAALLKLVCTALQNGGYGTVACADGAVRLCRIQPEGKAAMSDCDYLRGNRIAVGTVLE